MQNTGKPKQKSTTDGLSKFEKAQKLFQDIENIIEQELANTPIIAANYETNIARIKKSKRKRPGLIRNFNSKKNRQVIGGMEFDPETMTWLGNDEALSAFSPQQPALITNRGKQDKARVVGKMVWDPKEHKWKGNEKDALKFTPRKPALITPLGSNYMQKEVSGMVFDPVAMRWVGNDNAADIFASIDTLDDTGFTVGNEFHLSPALTKSFHECANRHKSSLSGWFADNTVDRKSYLYAIRNMSILRVVRDVKQRRAAYMEVDDELDSNIPERDVPSPAATSPRETLASKNTGNGNSDTAEDYDDLPLTPTTQLKLSTPASGGDDDDWDKDFGDEPLSSRVTTPTPALPVVPNLGKKVEVEEDWDSDFAEADSDTFNKLELPKPKPFQENKENRGSIVDLRERTKNNMQPKPKPVIEEFDEDGLELPPGTMQLVPSQKRSAVDSGNDSGFDEESSSSNLATETEDGFEEEEEDWTDVDIPAALPSQPLLKPHHDTDREDWDNDSDIQISPTNTLTLKKPVKTSDDDEEEDLLAGVEIPADFASRIKK
jgi:hypothetical protein